jgi:zinc protease
VIKSLFAVFALVTVIASPATIFPAAAAEPSVLYVQVIKSEGGIEAWLVEDHRLPVISMNFAFNGGLAYDPEDKPGVARLVSILLDEGAGDIRSQEFQSKLSDNAISLSFTPGRDAFYGSVKTITPNSPLAFDLLRLALTAPRFDPDAVERMKNANVSDIRKDLGDPAWLVARTFNGMIFEGHYYSAPGAGTLDSMSKITRNDLVGFTRAQFARDVLRVAIVGDITKEQALKMLDDVFGRLPEKAESMQAQAAKLNYPGKTVLLPLDTPQTYISMGTEGISRQDKDWHAALVLNYILGGGGFDSRLMKEIREKRGLTYGVYAAFNTMDHANIVQVNMSAGNDKAEESVRLVRDEFAKMAKDGASAQEIADAKSYLTGSLPLELTSTGDIAGALSSLQQDGLPPDYLNIRNKEINAVTAADIKRVAERLLKADNLTTILVGQPKNINVDILLDKPPGMKEPGKTK